MFTIFIGKAFSLFQIEREDGMVIPPSDGPIIIW
jgi:hypothetical protein